MRLLLKNFANQRNLLAVYFIIVLLLISVTSIVMASTTTQSVENGKEIFDQKCAACHAIDNTRLIGPGLLGVTAMRDLDWVRAFIMTPDQVLGSDDPVAAELLEEYGGLKMPNVGLTESETEDVLAYLISLDAEVIPTDEPEPTESEPTDKPTATNSEATEPEATEVVVEEEQAPSPSPTSPPAGDAIIGQNLFTGVEKFENGAAACISCHHASEVGALGGGNLGPDLTHSFQNFGETGLNSVLDNIPFPMMQSVYNDSPLSEREIEHLVAYMKKTDQEPEGKSAADVTPIFWILGIVGSVILFGIMTVSWVRSRHSISEDLRRRA
jgi:mono/diheme cytochrome c family protein